MNGDFLAIDWGTTNRRIYAIDAAGNVVHGERDDRGVLAIPENGFGAEIEALRGRLGDLPILCAGMVGSTRGWVEAPYVRAPSGLAELAAALCWVEPGRTAIIPGLCDVSGGRADVMRGEEVQFLGAAAADMVPADAMLCQPGTHCKWARVANGRVVEFTTAMTGEVFSLLHSYSLLAPLIQGAVEPNEAFLNGVAKAADGDLLADLFGVRASALLGTRPVGDNAAYVSGLLIGSDVRARLSEGTREVYVLADPGLGGLYGAAIEAQGATARIIDSPAAFVAGITRIWSQAA